MSVQGNQIARAARIYLAGHTGLVGSALHRSLAMRGFLNVITRSHEALDLTSQSAVERFFNEERPEYVLLAAARVGGIHANSTRPAEFIRDNLLMQTNVIDAAYRSGVRKLLLLGSSCIYPRFAPQPMTEDALLTGALEPTNEPYAVAKIAGIKMCQAYRRQYGFDAIALMPTNLYGPNDNFDPLQSHVVPGLIRRFYEAVRSGADSVTVWGSGKPRREFLHVNDLADAALFLLNCFSSEQPINVGAGVDITILELAQLLAEISGFKGEIVFDATKPDGAPRKLLDIGRLTALGWKPSIPLRSGLKQTYDWYALHCGARELSRADATPA